MKATFTEREAQREYIDFIKQEITRLNGEYKLALDRIRQLDEIEAKAAAPVPTPSQGMDYDSVALVSVAEQAKESAMSLEEAIQRHNQIHQPDNSIETPSCNLDPKINLTVKESPRFTKQVEELKDKDQKKAGKRQSSQRDIKKVTADIISILKEAGAPMKTKRLIEALEEKGYDMYSPYVVINQAKAYDPRIDSASFGYYQYKW
jgi:transcriptional regulator of acetoin/glycerol metabolism